MEEPRYVDIDEDDEHERKRPKWQLPDTEFQKRVLAIFNRKYFLTRTERARMIAIEKGMLPFGINPAHPPQYPSEWVQEILEWARDARRKGRGIPFQNWLSAVNNEDRKQEWIERKQREYRNSPPGPMTNEKGVEVHYGSLTKYQAEDPGTPD